MDAPIQPSDSPEITQFELDLIPSSEPDKVLSYFVRSTAPINVDDLDDHTQPPPTNQVPVVEEIRNIAQYLLQGDNPEIVISIHGYGTQREDAEKRYRKIHHYAEHICTPGATVFLGYLWPSEKPTGDPDTSEKSIWDKIRSAHQALPVLPAQLFWRSLTVALLSALLLAFTQAYNGVLTVLLVLAVALFGVLLALILLRLSTYFRDNYRATNFGVPDLVELFRQIDQAVVEADKTGKIAKGGNRIKLTFIGHSMGCFVVTNTIRILSEVFDPLSIEKKPRPNIGRVFALARLVLVAPDIPIETIVPRRANFLRSSLRRCEEAYVFTNEADLALRLASTAANYINFPAKTRSSGYRLGNITVARFGGMRDRTNRRLQKEDYGIVNLKDGICESSPDYLEIRASVHEHQKLTEIRYKGSVATENLEIATNVPVPDLFTYFDCTDYVDYHYDGELEEAETKGKYEAVVSYATGKSALDFYDYLWVGFAYFLKWKRPINVHGGYFDGVLSQHLIYNLAFVGFKRSLHALAQDEKWKDTPFNQLSLEERKALVKQLSETCCEKGIQVVLSPIRYGLDVLGEQ